MRVSETLRRASRARPSLVARRRQPRREGGARREPRRRRRARRASGSPSRRPFLALAALATKLEDGGPVLYRQRRVGKDGAEFELLSCGRWSSAPSTRAPATRSTGATRGSRGSAAILRKTSIDELPQLWNVIRGDMSVIGPRPTLRYQVERYTPRQRRRLDVQAGADRLGAGPRPGGAAVGGAHRARRLVRRAPLAAGST